MTVVMAGVSDYPASGQEKNKKTAANTNNKGKLFVTVFAFAPTPKTYS
jgi:hypothetical protein